MRQALPLGDGVKYDMPLHAGYSTLRNDTGERPDVPVVERGFAQLNGSGAAMGLTSKGELAVNTSHRHSVDISPANKQSIPSGTECRENFREETEPGIFSEQSIGDLAASTETVEVPAKKLHEVL